MIGDEDNGVIADGDDDNFSLDMGSVPDQVRSVVPKGEYDCVISALEYKRSASKDQPMWSIQLEITEGDYAGRKLFTVISFSPAALSMAKMAIKTFAPELLEMGAAFKPKQVADEGTLLGKICRVKTKIEKYEGEDQTRVARWVEPKAANAFMA
jgi:hypothetical protein